MLALFVFDVGGVFRDSSLAINEGFKRGFISCGLSYHFNSQDVWHLRGIGKYNNSRNCVKALLAVLRTKYGLPGLISRNDAEKKLDEIIKKNIKSKDEREINGIGKSYKRFFNSQKAKKLIRLYPNIKKSIDLLLGRGYKLAIFTNSSAISVKRDLKRLDLNGFSLILSEEDVKNKKPSGEGITRIIKNMNISPKKTVYIGDSVVDILAARDAKCQSVAVTCGMGIKKHLIKEKPDFIFENIFEMAKYFSNKS